jgi:hypothetical protein
MSPGVRIGFFRLCLFLLYNRKHITANKKPPTVDPIAVAIITCCCKLAAESEGCGCDGDGDGDDDGGDDGGDDDGCDDGDDGDDDDDGGDGGGGGGSKVFVHLYSSLLLISSNKISLSVVSDLRPIKNLIIFC